MFLHPEAVHAGMAWADPWTDAWKKHCPSSLHFSLPSVECISLCIHHFDGAACNWLAWSKRVKCVLACYEMGSFVHVAESCPVSAWPPNMLTNTFMQQYIFDILCSRVPGRLCAVLHQLSPGNGMHAWRLLCEWFQTGPLHENAECNGVNLSSAPTKDWKRGMPCEGPSDKMQVLADNNMHLHTDECMQHDDVSESTDATDASVPPPDVPASTDVCVCDSHVSGCIDTGVSSASTVMCVSDFDVVACTDTGVPSSFCGFVNSTCSDTEISTCTSPCMKQRIPCVLLHTKHHVEQCMHVSNTWVNDVHASMATSDMHALSPYAVEHFFTTALQTG